MVDKHSEDDCDQHGREQGEEAEGVEWDCRVIGRLGPHDGEKRIKQEAEDGCPEETNICTVNMIGVPLASLHLPACVTAIFISGGSVGLRRLGRKIHSAISFSMTEC